DDGELVQVQRFEFRNPSVPQPSRRAREEDLVAQSFDHQIAVTDKRGLADKCTKGRAQRLVVIASSVAHNARAFVADSFFQDADAVGMILVDEKWRMSDVDHLHPAALAIGKGEGLKNLE